MSLKERLELTKKYKRAKNEGVIQVKVDAELRDSLNEALEEDGLSYKDLFLSAIEEYLATRDP